MAYSLKYKGTVGNLFEISELQECRIFFEKSQDSRQRWFYSAYVQLPDSRQIILDDRILPRLRQRLNTVLAVMNAPFPAGAAA